MSILKFNKFVLLGLLLVSTLSNVYCFNIGSEILRQEPQGQELSLEQLKEFKEETKQKETEEIKHEQEKIQEQERAQEQIKESSTETRSEAPKEPNVSLEKPTEKHEPEKPEEKPKISVEQKQDTLSEINKAGGKVKELARLWNEAWEKRTPEETASVIFNRINRQLDLASLGDTLKLKPFELDQLANPLQKAAELKAQESALQSFDTVLSDISNQLIEKYKRYTKPKLTEAERIELADAAVIIAAITNMQTNIIAEEQKVFDVITSVDLWQQSSFKNLFHGTNLAELSFEPHNLTETSKLVKEVTAKLEDMTKRSATVKMTSPEALDIDEQLLESAVETINQKLKELEKDKRQTEEFVQAKSLLQKLLVAAENAHGEVQDQNWTIQNQTFASRVTNFGTSLRNTIASFFSIVTGNSPILRAIQTKSGGYGAEERPQQRALQDLYETGANKDRRIQAYKELQKHAVQLDKSLQFAKRLVKSLERGDITSFSEEKKRMLIQLRSTLVEQISSMQKLGKMIGIEIKNPSDTIGASIIGFAKKFYTPTLLNAAEEDMWLLPYIAKEASILGGGVRNLDLQSQDAISLLKTLDSKIFKQSSTGASALYNVSLATEILAEAGGVAAIGTMVGVGAFSTLTGMDLPFQDILDWTPLIFVSGASLMYIISYASYQGAVKLGKVSG